MVPKVRVLPDMRLFVELCPYIVGVVFSFVTFHIFACYQSSAV